MGQRSFERTGRSGKSTGSPSTLSTRPSVSGPTGTEIGSPRSTSFIPRCMPSVAFLASALGRPLDAQGVINLGQVSGLELDVDDRPDDLNDPADVLRCRGCGCHM